MRLRFALVLVLALAACGDDGRTGGTPARAQGGEATYCVDRLDAWTERPAVKRFNRANERRRYSARIRVLGADDEVLPETCDVALIHAVSIGDLAAEGRLADLTDRVEARKEDFVPSTLGLARYDDRYWGLPKFADVGFLYYENDIGTPPFTWQEAYRKQGLVYAGSAGPSLALHFVELSLAAGGRVLSEDGTTALIDSPQNLRVLELMRRGITSGTVPASVTRMDDEDARHAYDASANLMRGWTYVYEASNVGSFQQIGNQDIVELPAWGDREPTALVTGSSVVVAEGSADEPVAHALADHLTGSDEAWRLIDRARVVTALTKSYEPDEPVEALDYGIELERTLGRATAQPVVPGWVWMQEAIAKRVHAALVGRMTPRAALRAAQRDVEEILIEGTSPSSVA